MRLVRVPLRISLVGGGSDVPAHYEKYGGSVLSFTIDKYIYISAKPNESLFPHKYRLVYSQVEQCNNRSEIKHPIIRQLVDDYGIGSLDLDVMSDIPAGTGMGSSSAFTVGMHMALGGITDKHELAENACRTELEDLKEPIGKQDQYAAAFGGLNHIDFSSGGRVTLYPIVLPNAESIALLDSLHLVYVGGVRSASEQLANQRIEDHSESLEKLDRLAWSGAIGLHSGNIGLLGHHIKKGWELKKSLSPNVSTPLVDTIIDTALANGATGGKLLGAGGAGFVLLFCPPDEQAKMLTALRPLNPNYVPFNFDKEGARILYEDTN